jgi:CBS domain-containing protein
MPDREAFIEKLEARMREWSARLDELKARARKVTSARRAEHAERIAALQARRDEVVKKIRELRGTGEHAFEELREAAEKGWHELSAALDGAISRLRVHAASEAEATKVGDVMSRDVASCSAADPLNVAARIFWERDCGSVPVLDDGSHVLGMLTDRDACMAAYFSNRPLSELRVSDVMSKDVGVCAAADPLPVAEEIMSRRQVRRLPVVDEDHRLVGILSLNDIVREAAGEHPGRRPLGAPEVLRTLSAIGERKPERTQTSAA